MVDNTTMIASGVGAGVVGAHYFDLNETVGLTSDTEEAVAMGLVAVAAVYVVSTLV